MIALPTLAPEVPLRLRAGATDRAHAALAYTLINAGMLERADLRAGSGGLRRVIERTFERWWSEDGLPSHVDSALQFFITTKPTTHGIRGADDETPWLILAARGQVHRHYLRDRYIAWHARRPREAEHALAVLYEALDAVSYSLTPPRFLDFARRYWWENGEDLAPGQRKSTGFLTRKMFETRFSPLCLAPQRNPAWRSGAPEVVAGRIFGHALREARGALHPSPEVRAVEGLLAHPALLRRNAFELTDRAVHDYPILLRWRYDDDHGRLMDHWFAEFNEAPSERICQITGAWPLASTEDLARARAGIAATVNLIAATARLLNRLTSRSVGGFYL